MTPEQFKAWAARLGLSEAAMAAYLGVPVHTYRKWENGTRKPDAAPLRLFHVLQAIEVQSPDMHAGLLFDARASAPDKPAGAPKGRGRGKGAPGPENAPTAPPAPAPQPQDALPDWMKSAS